MPNVCIVRANVDGESALIRRAEIQLFELVSAQYRSTISPIRAWPVLRGAQTSPVGSVIDGCALRNMSHGVKPSSKA